MICFLACAEKPFFYQEEKINETSWKYEDKAVFEFEIQDTVGSYNLELELNHSSEFSFQNIYVAIETHFPDGKKTDDNISLQLMNKMGSWIGDCSSKTCTINFVLQQNTYFKQAGIYKLSLAQDGRNPVLDGIQSLGFRILKN